MARKFSEIIKSSPNAGGLERMDANESIFFDRQLEQIKQKLYEIRYPRLKARTFVPPSPEPAPVGVESFTFRVYDHVGTWKVISPYASDLPRVDLTATEMSFKLAPIGNAFGWSMDELDHARQARVDLSGQKGRAARAVIEDALDTIISFGLPDLEIYGFLNNPSVPVVNFPTSPGGVTEVDDLLLEDPNLLVGGLMSVENVIRTFSMETEYADTLLLPPTVFRALNQNNRSGATDRTLMDELRSKLPGITTIAEWELLETAGVGGVPRAVFYRRDADAVFYEIPREFTMLDPERKGLGWEVACIAKVGGTIYVYPLSARYLDFISNP